jgi:hypothetical protein
MGLKKESRWRSWQARGKWEEEDGTAFKRGSANTFRTGISYSMQLFMT